MAALGIIKMFTISILFSAFVGNFKQEFDLCNIIFNFNFFTQRGFFFNVGVRNFQHLLLLLFMQGQSLFYFLFICMMLNVKTDESKLLMINFYPINTLFFSIFFFSILFLLSTDVAYSTQKGIGHYTVDCVCNLFFYVFREWAGCTFV